MNARERLLRALFETEGRKHLNIKFCRGISDDISPDSLCQAANLAILQVEKGMVQTRPTFGDSGKPLVDVREL